VLLPMRNWINLAESIYYFKIHRMTEADSVLSLLLFVKGKVKGMKRIGNLDCPCRDWSVCAILFLFLQSFFIIYILLLVPSLNSSGGV
jgi:hypothetical protein